MLIKASKNTEEARNKLRKDSVLSDIQSRSYCRDVFENKLTGLEQDKIIEYDETMKLIGAFKSQVG
jgi:DNA gyrase subunit A